jgi:citrate lyase subunit beta/citryl-CoA lyase
VSEFVLGPALLFCPADRPERYGKALDRADAVILDLEDAVRREDKAGARAALVANPLAHDRVIVRVNAAGTEEFDLDIQALARTPYRTVMLAKAESAGQVRALSGYDVIALCETPAGVLAAPEIAAARNVVALMWGAEDLVAGLGGTASRTSSATYRDVARLARSMVLLAAGAKRIAAIDAVHIDVADHEGLAAEAADAAASGFAASACIHPEQVAVVRDAYRPPEAVIAYAKAILAAARAERGVFTHEGRMIDEPVLTHARRVLTRAGSPGSAGAGRR